MKTRILTIIVALVMSVVTAGADPITRSEALKKAQAFMAGQQNQRQLTPVVSTKKLSPRRFAAPLAETSEYYVFNKGTGDGFIIVSGDDRTEPILGYCDEGEFDYDKLPPAMREWLDDYVSQIAWLQQSGGTVICDAIPTHPKVDELMKSKWNQGYPYNLSCPQYFSLGQSVTGCVATAMAQILYYHREKSVSETTAAMPAYDTWTSHATYGRLHVEGIPEGAPIDWENMKDTYGSANDKQRKAVADLMHYCGVAVKMDYTNSSSGAQSYDAYLAFGKYFGYGSSVRYVDYTMMSSDVEWDKLIYNEIAAGRPVYISGANAGGGHAFVADGYDGNLKYHINWGWGGTSDGYYLLTNLTPGKQGVGGSSDGYNSSRQVVVGIEPENYGEKAMSFADATVKRLCLKNFDADGDGKLTYGEAATVTDIGAVFKGSYIKTFKELYYFTSLTSIPDDAFSGCKMLTTLRLPKNVKTIGNGSFKECQKLTTLELPNHVKNIGEEAFSGCKALTALTLPEELPVVADATFQGSGLKSVTLPISVTTIGRQAFAGCENLTTVELKTFQPSAITVDATAFSDIDLSKATLYCLQGTKTQLAATPVWQTFGTIAEKRELSGGKFAALESGKTYLLYHVGTGQYLTMGEAWGTQAIVGESPMRFKMNHSVMMPEGTYYLTSEDTGRGGNLLFRTSTDSNVGVGVKAAFVDGTLAQNSANSNWVIKEVSGGVYTIQVPVNASGYEEGKFWGVQTSHASNVASPTYGVYSDVSYADYPTGCQWRLVLYDEQQMTHFKEAQSLGRLLGIAQGRWLNVDAEQAVYDRIESTTAELRAAQRSLRKKLKFVDFAEDAVRDVFISTWDIDSDGELSLLEASKINEFNVSFQGNTQLKTFDELQYLTSIPDIYGNTFEGCTNLESVTLPESIVHIYYRAFRNCQSLTSITIPELVNTIGESCFYGCKSLTSVTVAVPDPSSISLGSNVFYGVRLSSCTLYVPFGSKSLYENADVWRNFGKIVEVRMRTQPSTSSLEVDKSGYIYNVGKRMYLTMGEAYGTQSVVAPKGDKYQLKRNSSMPAGHYYLYCEKNGGILFRTTTDTKVGTGVKACFGDGTLSSKAYWRIDSVAPRVYTLQVPSTETGYVKDEYLGIDESHTSAAASPTFGVYWDIAGTGVNSQWVFISADDMKTAQAMDELASQLKKKLQIAKERQIDVAAEQAVYDNSASTAQDFTQAIESIREKMHCITFADATAQTVCVEQWDTDGDGELSLEEAAAVTDIGETFSGVTGMKSLEELRYFTSLKNIPAKAFYSASALQTVYLPENVTSIGENAFMYCSSLKNLVIMSDAAKIPLAYINVPYNMMLFVPAKVLDAYSNDTEWKARCQVVEYTGRPVVTVEAQRPYGHNSATVTTKVSGAPVEGTPDFTCEVLEDVTLPVGTYPIKVTIGSVITPGVECREGVLTITPSPLIISVGKYTRNVGEENPEFKLSFRGFRNGENDAVLTARPVVTCEATAQSPAGEYKIRISGAAAQNYEITYIEGVLTVEDPTGIATVSSDHNEQPVYDLQGRRVEHPKRGLYIQNGRKILK